MSNEGLGGKPDEDYFGVRADHDHTPPAAAVGSNSAPPTSATTTSTHTPTEADGKRVSTPKNDSRRGHRDSKRAHKDRDSSRRGVKDSGRSGHKDSGREGNSDQLMTPSKELMNPHDNPDNHHKKKDNTKDLGGHIEEHNRRHTPKNLQPPPGATSSVMDDLEEMECYHGNILEDEIKAVLKNHGDYILRMTISAEGDKGIFVTIQWNDEQVNIPVRAKYFETEGGKEYMYTLDNKTRCLTIKDLIRKHTMMAIPVMRGKVEFWLLNPIAKQSWELRPENVELIKKLGEGAFGEVYSGKLRLPLKKFCNVAVKVIKRSANTEAATKELQKEAAIMRKLKHVNIVRFFGMVVKKDTIMVVMELINGGGLDKYLKKFPETSAEERTGWAGHIASGLAYLHMQGVMHRDVACRNCLLDMYRKVAKVSDFGLARKADEYKLRSDERIPIRWTAPEVVKTYIYTRQADIYAYAILVYEIFSNAALPFEGYSNAQIKDQIHNNDFRPKFPDTTPPKIVETITRCWHGDPRERTPLIEVARTFNLMAPKPDDDGAAPNARNSKEGKGGMSKEKLSKAKRPRSARSKDRGGKSREQIKSVKSGRTKRQGREGGGNMSRERTD